MFVTALVSPTTITQAFAAPPPSQKEVTPGRFARFEGTAVHYLSAGSGKQALVFVHGWTCNANFWRFQIPAFTKEFRVIAIDLPGHGLSDKPPVAYTPDLFAKAIDAVFKDAGIERAVLVGHSLGTLIIRQFYRKYPAKSQALVIVDGRLRMPEQSESMNALMAALRGPDFTKTLKGMVGGMTAPMPDSALREEVMEAMLKTPQHVAVSAIESMGDETIWQRDPIKVPVLAVLAKSPSWAPDTEAFLRSLAPNLEYHMLEGVSHFLMMDKPELFNATLRSFVTRAIRS